MPPKKFSLEDFQKLAGESGAGTSWADEEADFAPSFQTLSQPGGGLGGGGAPMGSWTSGSGGGGFDTAPLPDVPPFTARVGNVSYDVEESHLHEFFEAQHGLRVESLRLPRGPDGQIKGAAYIDFADRESLVAALKLGGSQILGRAISVSVAEQRGPPGFGGGGGAFGGGDFDWSKKVDTNEFFAQGAPDGSGAGGDRFSRFRPRAPRPDEPELDWSAPRQGPMAGAGGAGGFAPRGPPRAREPEPEFDWSARQGPIAGGGPRGPPRAAREPEPELDWSAPRQGPIAARGGPRGPPRAAREPEPEFDWSARSGPLPSRNSGGGGGGGGGPRGSRGSAPREPREPEPEFDWSARQGPLGRTPRAPRQPDLDWSARGRGAGSGSGSTASKGGAAAPRATLGASTTPATPRAEKKSSEASRIAKLQQGFKALQVDDDEPEADAAAAPAKKAPVAESIGDIQQAQREAATGNWSEA